MAGVRREADEGDADLGLFVRPNENAKQFFARCRVDPISTGVAFLPALRPGQVLEIVGPSGTAKTETLIQVAANSILPTKWRGLSFGGHGENLLFIDLDAKFDILRLYQLLTARVLSSLGAATLSDDEVDAIREEVTDAALRRFHMITCHSSADLFIAVEALEPVVARLQDRGQRLLLVDNVAAFFWLDRALQASMQRPGAAAGRRPTALTLDAMHATASAKLRHILQHHRLAAVVTKHAALGLGGWGDGRGAEERAEGSWEHRELLPPAWQGLVTHRILLRALGATGPTGPERYGAKWHMPPQDTVATFCITDAGFVPC